MEFPRSLFALPFVLACTSSASFGAVNTVKFTASALGLGSGSTEINEGSTIESDIAGKLVTGSATGSGTTLFVQRSGLAGSGTSSDPLMLKVTCRTRLDTVSGFPDSGDGDDDDDDDFNGGSGPNSARDYQVGVLYVSKSGTSNMGKDEGLGVRAFNTDSNGIRKTTDGKARLTGSVQMNGGSGPTEFDPSPTDEPVDEEIMVEFSPTSQMIGDSISILLSKFGSDDRIELTINLVDGSVLHFASLGESSSAMSSLGNSVEMLSFSGLSGLASTAVVSSFTIRALEPDSSDLAGGGSSTGGMLLAGLQGTMVPAPGAASLLAIAGMVGARRRRR